MNDDQKKQFLRLMAAIQDVENEVVDRTAKLEQLKLAYSEAVAKLYHAKLDLQQFVEDVSAK